MAFRRIGTTTRVRTCGHCGKTGLARTVVFQDGHRKVHLGSACARDRGNVSVAARHDRADAATELKLFIENDADLYRHHGLPILKNLANKAANGEFNREKAIKLYMYLMENGAKKYVKENGGPGDQWHEIFNLPTRREAAREFINDFEAEYKTGNYDRYLTKAAAKRKAAGMGNLARRRG